ncbi:hypothetical protein C6370_19950 [Bacillus atrophaeus]|uniref:NACHT domain-containing protein n=1 Tax=Bacillus atrophaeus TaxID=1452 RepID=UPI000D0825FE|nr:hypothetical protein [Bacillus atrophaeus]PSA89253.1 hypothetical protein C6370_19950 [Bacillus atrophaeus]
MSGQTSRYGFRFQDLYLLEQIFLDIASRKKDEISGKIHKEKKFGVEAKTPDTGTTDWDILVIDDEKHKVLEVKSGAVNQKDRVSFWLRIREEIFQTDIKPNDISPGLVINSDKKPVALQAWLDLSERTSFDNNTNWKIPNEAPKRVATETQLIDEALYWICSAETIGERVLSSKVSKDKALSVLLQFKLYQVSGKSLEQKVESIIERLTFIPEPSVLRHQLEGWISNCATSEIHSIHLFTVNQMFHEIRLLEKFLEQDSDALRLAKLLKNEYSLGCLNNWKSKFSEQNGLQYKPLKEVQYSIFEIDWNKQQQSIALLADAGYGKSRTLYELHKQLNQATSVKFDIVTLLTEDVVEYLAGEKKSVLLRALLLLVDLAVLSDKRLLLLVDGLDQIPKQKRSILSSLLHTVSQRPGFLGVITSRKVDWEEQGKLKENLQTWQKQSLAKWPENVVRSVLNQYGINRNLSKGIIALLGIPLYLDIFIRVFAIPTKKEKYLQTRHGLLKAYWEHVILNDQSIKKWKVLKEACDQISEKNYWIPSEQIDDDILESLISSGLIIRVNARARYDFRHSLLRDFALAQWILEASEEDPAVIDSSLDAIQSSAIIRFGAQRALLEALSDVDNTGCKIEDYVFHANNLEKKQIARILGGLNPNPSMDIIAWNRKPEPTFVDSLILSAQYHLNSNWASIFSTWPASKVWAEQQTWIGETTLERLSDYLEVLANPQLIETKDANKNNHLIGNIILEWASAAKFQSELRKNDSWLMMKIIPIVSRWSDLERAIEWLFEEIPYSTWRTRHAALESLVLLAARDQSENQGHGKVLGEMYCGFIGLYRDGDLPSLDKTLASDNMLPHYVVDWSLIGTHDVKALPLVDQIPSTFFPILMDLLLALQLNEASYRKGLEVEIESGKKILDDKFSMYYWNSTYEHDMEIKLYKGLHQRLKKWLATKPMLIDELMTFFLKSPLASFRTLLIQIFLEEKNGDKLLSVIKGIILDERMYHVWGSHYWVGRTLQNIWNFLNEKEREQIFNILINVSESPYVNGLYVAGVILSCIPLSNSDKLKTILNDFNEQGYCTGLRDPREEIDKGVWKNVDSDINKRFILRAVGGWEKPINKELMVNFYQVMSELEKPNKSYVVATVNRAIILLQKVLPAISASLNQLQKNSWPIRQIQILLSTYQRLLQTEANSAGLLPLQREMIYTVAQIATKLLQQSPLPETPEDFYQGKSMVTPGDSWTQSLCLLDQVMTEDIVRNMDELFNIAYAEIKKVYSQALPFQQCLCMIEFRAWHWFRTDKQRVELLEGLILGDNTTGIALSWGISLLNYFPALELDRIIRILLSKKSIPFTDEFLDRLGRFTGYRAMSTNYKNKRLLTGKLIDAIISKPSEFPLLDDKKNRVDFFNGMAFGLKEVASVSVSNNELAYEYGNWMFHFWEIIKDENYYRDKDLILFAMHWIVNPERDMKMSDISVWWQSIYPLLKRVVLEGTRREVQTVIFAISRNEIEMVRAKEGIELIELFIQRILATPDEINVTDPQNNEWHSWRKISDYAADVIQSISKRAECERFEKEQCYVLLNKLANQPIKSVEAERIIIRLQRDIE